MKGKTIENGYRYNNFWLIAGLLSLLLGVILTRDITRPFTGLHSWAQASGSVTSRAHARYGFGYTKGIATWALGNPPPANPQRYWDHPQGSVLIGGLFMAVFGQHEWSTRIGGLLSGLLSLLIFMKIMRGLVRDDRVTILSAVFLIIFPITGYFGIGGWEISTALGAIYCYLVCIGALIDSPKPKIWHRIVLGGCLFLTLQFSWLGFFYAFAIGSHYVLGCVFKRKKPDWPLLSILFFAPVLSLVLTFTIMAGGYGWDISKIIELYKWRSAKGEMQQMQGFDWNAWFSQLWLFCVEDFTVPVLFIALAYLTFGQLFVFMETKKDETTGKRSRQFPMGWLFIFPAILFLLVFRGLVWKHQYWLKPLSFPLAISAAMAILLIWDFIKRFNRNAAIGVVTGIIILISGYCVAGTNYFHSIRWQPQAKIDMFEMLNEVIPPDKRLLSFEDFIVNQHRAKGGFIRPEIAWYLDREIDTARTLQEIEEKAKTGMYPCYLMPLAYYDQKTTQYLNQLSSQLRQIYKFEYIPGAAGKTTKEGKFLKAGMNSYMIFYLNSRAK
ncbi:MAG: hypothetical protein PHF37_07335 [Phycisphaerae bacterium]|nr:hypothetical protein [Phycisphaerae bacterium]